MCNLHSDCILSSLIIEQAFKAILGEYQETRPDAIAPYSSVLLTFDFLKFLKANFLSCFPTCLIIRILVVEFVSDFGFRASDLVAAMPRCEILGAKYVMIL